MDAKIFFDNLKADCKLFSNKEKVTELVQATWKKKSELDYSALKIFMTHLAIAHSASTRNSESPSTDLLEFALQATEFERLEFLKRCMAEKIFSSCPCCGVKTTAV